ncbi:MAG: hypothetical protein ACR2PC_02965 [Tsuneonella suprasediminis]|uniref:Uncharacterized protein n=1 Tax=Tsuneonella suprasediminis TaxID=2306996 RepID=A0A419QY70_9SPHN|nr:hypothetical protein [Tsuneonella suprasediminis]RJX65466.1 hypothetical protein D6858_14155 [Tsuneonella suprasediminis]UBS33720.1 hypothetical protein LBX01_03600 [Altererythrobacter sp. N1]
MTLNETLTREDVEEAFRRATNSVVEAAERWAARAEFGLTDEELAEALRYELGIAGGTGGRGALCVAYQGAGLKIWAGKSGWALTPPILEGQRTIAFAREYCGIPNPSDEQMKLL